MKRIIMLVFVLSGAIILLSGCGEGRGISDQSETVRFAEEATEKSASASHPFSSETVDSAEETTEKATSASHPYSSKVIPPAHAFDDGTGTEADPWQIATKEQLALLSHIYQNYSDYYRQYFYEQNPYFVLTKDIILNEIDHPEDFNTLSEAFLWEPIGNSSNSFCDHFDGAGHTIRGVVIVTDATNIPYNDITAQGLFGTVGHGAVIKNVRLEACYNPTLPLKKVKTEP